MKRQEIAFVAFGAWDAAGAKAFGYSTYWVKRMNLAVEELGTLAHASYRDLSFLPKFINSRRSTGLRRSEGARTSGASAHRREYLS